MDHADAFLQDILAHPDDDAPRLIYADWLSDQDDRAGRARAEFIRVQYALEELPPGDLRRVALEDRQRDILVGHEAEWTAGLRDLGIREWRFRRGFVEGVKIHPGRLVSAGERLRARFPIREVQFIGWEDVAYSATSWSDWEALGELLVLEQLTSLDLTRYETLDAATAGSLLGSGRLKKLESLSLGRTSAPALLSDAAEMPALRTLCLTGAWGPSVAPVFAAPCIGRLTRLELHGALSRDEAFALAKSFHFDHLEELALKNLPLDDAAARRLGKKCFPRLRHLELTLMGYRVSTLFAAHSAEPGFVSSLRSLDLSSNGLSDDCGDWFTSGRLADLGHLNLSGNRIGAEGVRALAGPERLPSLQSLNLRTNRLGDGGLAALVSGNLPLRELNVSYNGITAAGLHALAKRWPRHLESLDLSWNPCREEGILALTSSLSFSELKRLDLSYCELTDRAAEALGRCPGLGELQTLNLGTNRIGDAGLAALAHSPYLSNLRTLHLGNSGVTHEGVEVLLDSPLLDRLEVLMLNGTDLSTFTRKRLRKAFRGILG